MSMKGNRGLALIFIAVGLIIASHMIGIHLHLMGYLLPLSMVGLGYVGICNGKKIGWLIAAAGALILAVKLSGFIAFALAIALIGYGFRLLGRRAHSDRFDL